MSTILAQIIHPTDEDLSVGTPTTGGRASCGAWRWLNCLTILSRNGGRFQGIQTFSVYTAGIFCEELYEAA